MTYDFLATTMFATLVLVLLLGFPVAFSLAAVGGAFGIIGVLTDHFDAMFLTAITFRVEGFFDNDNLLAIPLLILMGMLLERTGLAEDMLLALNRLFGALPGGLGYTVIIVGAVLSAITGFVSASVMALGLISLPVMLRSGYRHRFAAGVIAAAGTLAQVLPPSLVLIVLAEQLDVSLIDVYRGALRPALLLICLYLAYVFVATWRNPALAPALTHDASDRTAGSVLVEVLISAGLPVGLVGAVLATIYFGIAAPSEGGAIGVTGVLLLAAARGRLSMRKLKQALEIAGILCSCVIFLLFGSSFFTLVFRGLNGHLWIESIFQHVPAGNLGFLIFVNFGIFVLAFFLDFFEIAFIVLPLIAPIAQKSGIDMVWLTVLLALNLQTSFMHPPFGLALYNLRSIAPKDVKTVDIYLGALPFLAIQVLMIAILIAVPGIVSEAKITAPPVGQIKIDIPLIDVSPRFSTDR